jgi:hypothetical protein
LNYRPHGKRSLGRLLKRWSEIIIISRCRLLLLLLLLVDDDDDE